MSLSPVVYALHVAGEPADTVVYLRLREALSEPYECELVVALPLDAPLPARWLGAPARVEMRHEALTRQVLGVVRRIEDLGATAVKQYLRLWVVPSLWHLSQRMDSRIFQNLNVPDIVQQVLRDAGAYEGDRLTIAEALRELPPREYCVQYRERDLDFVMRLLQEEGVAFYFEHEGDLGETLCLVDGTERRLHVATLDGEPSVPLLDDGGGTSDVETVHRFDWQASLRPTGTFLRDYDFTRPGAVLDLSPSVGGGPRSIYDQPARLNLHPWDDDAHAWRGHDGTRQARIRLEAEQLDALTAVGTGEVTGFMPGSAFKLRGHARHELDIPWLLVAVEHIAHAWGDVPEDMSGRGPFASVVRSLGVEVPGLTRDRRPDDRYANRFRCVPSERPFRPARVTPRPLVHGAQTALVVGPAGEEIHVDHHGRIKVQFHWDRLGRYDEKSTCWIRTSQLWSGPGWGAMFIPRIGMEVVVTFLEGDPDRPLVTGCVYNGQNGVPYPLPEEKTKSTLKTNSSPTSGGYNELRFEDRRGSEQVYLQAERDWDTLVKHDQTLTVLQHRTKLVEGRERNTIVKDRTTLVQQNDSLTIEGNHDTHVQGLLGASVKVDATLLIVADQRMLLQCGDSSVELTPDVLTVHAKTVQVRGEQLINLWAPTVKINTDEAPGVSTETMGGGTTEEAPLEAQGGGMSSRFWNLFDPKQLATLASGGLGGLLKRLGIPPRICERLTGLAERTVESILTALREGRRPSWSSIAEDAVSTSVGIGVNEAFRPLLESDVVKKSPFLTGLLNEAQGATTTAASYGVDYALGLRDGLARDPFWQVMEEKHGEALQKFFIDQAYGVAQQGVDNWNRDNSATAATTTPANDTASTTTSTSTPSTATPSPTAPSPRTPSPTPSPRPPTPETQPSTPAPSPPAPLTYTIPWATSQGAQRGVETGITTCCPMPVTVAGATR